jgi:hypothetical protein
MAHANVYIRRANESKWATIQDKSAWLNRKLEEDREVKPASQVSVSGDEFKKLTGLGAQG